MLASFRLIILHHSRAPFSLCTVPLAMRTSSSSRIRTSQPSSPPPRTTRARLYRTLYLVETLHGVLHACVRERVSGGGPRLCRFGLNGFAWGHAR
ncbi:hypothetical protein DFH08DRAFT_848562 [Mycena albidolilacea]|uniref:Uncharacterized protein n=1 Tax=Mycena albidolilacea TaxID=1033008 RepID=A0AAD7AH24_9AGAR|nr:hypothetical protein DFH08DRAFT_848562 [Mycena albidolilacea]